MMKSTRFFFLRRVDNRKISSRNLNVYRGRSKRIPDIAFHSAK